MKNTPLILVLILLFGLSWSNPANAKSLPSRVNEAFRLVFNRNPNHAENVYWLGRVVKGEKNTFTALTGAMYYHQARGQTIGRATSHATQSARVAGNKTSDKNQLIKDTLPIFVQIYGNDPSKTEKAWWRKRISCGEIKSVSQLKKSMRYHQVHRVRKGRDTICGAKGGGRGGVIRRSITGISSHPMGNQVRIGIFHTDGRAIHLTSSGQYQIREGASNILATLGKDDIVQVSWSDNKYHVRGSGLTLDTRDRIRLVPLHQAIMQIKSYSDPSTTIPGKNYNRFRGIVEIRKAQGSNELWAINELRTEYYLRGLAETSGEGPVEYLKALAVAARTYVLYHQSVTGGRNSARGYDISRTPDDQIYRGYEYEIITPRMASTFNKVKGVIVTDKEGDKPVSTVYFSDSDGRTRSAQEKWHTNRFPHLQHSVKDPHHISSSCRGHCVGMSAQGAYGFAKQDGWSYQKILKYFYQGVKLVRAY